MLLHAVGGSLKCPVCFQPFAPPKRIFYCPRAHNVCNTCAHSQKILREPANSKTISCPTCRVERVPLDRFNNFVENICEVFFPAGLNADPNKMEIRPLNEFMASGSSSSRSYIFSLPDDDNTATSGMSYLQLFSSLHCFYRQFFLDQLAGLSGVNNMDLPMHLPREMGECILFVSHLKEIHFFFMFYRCWRR